MKSTTSIPRPSALGISLFPLQTVFCGLIGMLTMLNAMFTAAAGTAGGDGPPAPQAEAARLATEVGARARETTDLERNIAEAVALADRVALERRRHDELAQRAQDEREAAAAKSEAAEGARQEHEQLLARLRELEAGNAELERRIAERERQIDDAKKAIAVVNGRLGLRPRYVECTATGLVLDPDQPTRRATVARTAIANSSALKALLQDVRRQEASGWRAIFLVRPRSVAAYDQAVAVANGLSVRCGNIAVPNDLPLTFGGLPTAGTTGN